MTILQSDFRNSRLLSQFGNDKFEKRLNYDQIWYTGVSEVADQDFVIGLLKFKMADIIWCYVYPHVTLVNSKRKA